MPVSPNMKVSDVLKRYPQLLDVLFEQSPHFWRLRNPVLRRIFPRLVTVAQAAVMGGLEPAALVRTLNSALGEADAEIGPITINSIAGASPPPWLESAQVAAALDVRESQRRRVDPFATIMAAVSPVAVGQVFQLRNSFEPLPLYDVLGKRGFVPWARQLAQDDWEIFFFRASDRGAIPCEIAAPVDRSHSAVVQEKGCSSNSDEISIDVRGLLPPQPMARILDALDRLKQGQTLIVHHARRPVHLYPRLSELGYVYETTELAPDRVDIRIRKA